MSEHWSDKLTELDACADAVEWAREYDTLAEAWAECERGDWMLWLAGVMCGGPRSRSRKVLVLAACECARTVWKWMPKEGKAAISLAEKWTRGEATLKQVRDASYASYASSAASYASCASSAASYASYASYAASFAAYAASAASSASYAAIREKWLAKCADIVRKHYPQPPKI